MCDSGQMREKHELCVVWVFTHNVIWRSVHTGTFHEMVHCMKVSSDGDAVCSLLAIVSCSTLLQKQINTTTVLNKKQLLCFCTNVRCYTSFIQYVGCTYLISLCFKIDADTWPPSTYRTSHPCIQYHMHFSTPYIICQVLFIVTSPTHLATQK